MKTGNKKALAQVSVFVVLNVVKYSINWAFHCDEQCHTGLHL